MGPIGTSLREDRADEKVVVAGSKRKTSQERWLRVLGEERRTVAPTGSSTMSEESGLGEEEVAVSLNQTESSSTEHKPM